MEALLFDKTLDRRGKTIATYVVFDATTALATMEEGEVLELLTDDYEPLHRDITAWCETTGQVLLSSERIEEGQRFLIEKRAPKFEDQ